MVKLPWNRDDGEPTGTDPAAEHADAHADAVVVCEFQDGTLAVHDDRVVIERVPRSKFDDKTIPVDELRGVDYSAGITIGYIQIEQAGVAVDSGGLLSDPINENTLHFGRGDRDCAENARDAIAARVGD
ncbi:hypothetical protein BRD01_12860 [Halobacteriales archaeon QS_8_65_32]|nr:MAG: hypothetical protein BRD01_12860 [Halobacteriales archaeon QS_8_65_32]